MTRGLAVILLTVALDAAGVGLAMPILPSLLRELGHGVAVDRHYGLLISAYAAMQFLCSPVLGALSDRFGRRRVLLISLAGAAVDYAIAAATPSLWLLYASRLVAGVTGATMPVASAYIVDLAAPEDRARRFGHLNAAFGLGFIAGPLLGGWLGEISPRAPFVAASILCALNFAMGLLRLPATNAPVGEARARWRWRDINPFLALHGAFGIARLRPLLVIYGLIGLIGQVPAAIWVIYGQDRYGWSTLVVGASLAIFGLSHAGVQALLPGPLIRRVGERWAAALAMLVDGAVYVWAGVAGKGWLLLAITPVFAFGGIAVPAISTLMTHETPDNAQGQLQGNLAALMSLASIVGPLGVTLAYAATKVALPGFVWFAGASLYVICLALLAALPKASQAARRLE